MTLCDHGHESYHVITDDGTRTGMIVGECPGPIVNIAFRCLDPDRPGHVEVDVFVGRRHQGRGRAGRITLRRDEWEEIVERLEANEPIELGLTT